MTRLTPEQIAEIKARHEVECVDEFDIAIRAQAGPTHRYTNAFNDRAALLSHIESDGWQTMETAPRKPYYRVLLGSPEIPESASDDGYPAISTTGFYLDAEPDGPDSMGHDAGWVDEDYGTYDPGRSFGNPQYFRNPSQPTHWRPLPAPPETKEG